jgi:hypothetical protein
MIEGCNDCHGTIGSQHARDRAASRITTGAEVSSLVERAHGKLEMAAADLAYTIPYTPDSSLTSGFHVRAAVGGGPPHLFEVDTGSVGILVPRKALGPDFQTFDPSKDIDFGYVSSGKRYKGQWVRLSVVVGVPQGWNGSGDYPTAKVEVFAVDDPPTFDGGMFGIGFAIGGKADGGPERNPLLHVTYQGASIAPGYTLTLQGIELGLGKASSAGFAVVPLQRNAAGTDWKQPTGNLDLPGFTASLPVLMDTGIADMLLWLAPAKRPSQWSRVATLPAGVSVSISMPVDSSSPPALQYSFVTGAANQPMAPTAVRWRDGTGINTGRNVMAGFDYLFDAADGRLGFRERTSK